MAGRNVTARFSVEADVEQAKRDLEGITQQVDQLGKTKVDNVRQELEQLTASTGKLAAGYTALTQEQRQAYQQREQDAQSVERLRRSYKTLEGALEAVDVQVQHGHRSAEDAVRIQGLLAQAYGRTNAAIAQSAQAFQGGVNATRAAIVAQESAAASTRRLNGVMQQAGWQVSDFANQMANGGNVATAAGMQLGQLMGSLGPLGAALGAVVNVGGVLIGALQKAGGAAVDTTTSFNDYAKAMEFAKKASEELKTATIASKAALEAEGRSALDAAEKRLIKAQADLKALEASLMQPGPMVGDASGQSGIAAAYLLQASRVKDLNLQLETLRGSMGSYNDGARAVTFSAGQAGGATKSLGEDVEKLRESLRGQIKDLGVEVSTFDQSNAAKLRSKLQTEAMTTARVADYKAVDAGTRALIDQAVAKQEQIDKLEEQKKAQEDATRAAEQAEAEAERLAEQHKKAIEHADKYVDRLKGETTALAQSERQRFIANKAMEFELQNRGKLSGAEMDSYLAKVRQEAGALYDSTEARKAKAKADEEATRALEKYQQDVTRVATDIGKDISENLWDQITGEAKAGDALDFFKNWAKRLAVEMLNQNIVLPITMQLVGSMPSLFGIQSPGSAANQNGGMGGAGNLLSMGSKFMPSSWTSGITGAIDSFGYSALGIGSQSSLLAGQAVLAPSAEVLASQTAMLQAVNPGLMVDGVAVTAAPTVTAGSSAGAAGGVAAGTGLSAYLGAAGAGAAGGGLVGGYLGTATNSKAVGGISGAVAGAGTAALASYMGLGALGGPVGLAIGAVAGAIMGMIGTQKATVGKTASADVTIASNGKSATYGNIQTDNDGDPAAGQALGKALSGIYSIAAMGGGSLTKDFGIGSTAKNGLYVAGSVPYKEFGDDIAGLLRYTLLEQGGLKDGGANTLKALQNTQAKDWEEAAKDIGLGASIDAGNTALKEMVKTLGGVTDAAKKATTESFAPMFEELSRAQKLGIGDAYVGLASEQLKAYLDQLRNPPDFTQVQTDMAALKGQFQAAREAYAQLNPAMVTYVDQIEAETRARMAANLNKSLDQQINEASGRGYVNQISGFMDALTANGKSLAAVGEPVTRAQTLFNAQLAGLLKTLDDTQRADVVATFGGSISNLSEVMQQAANDNTAAAQAASDIRSSWASMVSSALSAAQSVASQWSGAVDKIKSARLSLSLGEYSALNPGQQLAVAQKQWTDTLAKAQAGDVAAVEALQAAGDAFLKADRVVNATANPSAYNAVQAGLSSVETVAQRQLSSAQQQVSYLTSIDSTLKSLDANTASQAKMLEIISSPRNWGAASSTTANMQLALKTGYSGDFGGGGWQNWIVNQSDETKAIARQVLTAAGQGWRINGFATGTPAAPPGWAWVGEQGPELMRMKGGEPIIPNAAALDMARSWTVANDRWGGNVVPIRAPQSGGGSDGTAAAFDRLSAKIDRLIAAVERADANAGGQRGAIGADLVAVMREVRDEMADAPRRTANAMGK
ncbi:hypothetical protein M5E06_20895 [Azospirillum sp. A1-3]|uniref:hypothetical protein n=1 Tax=Azospirillum sp. A1-3 TaxID=185874 RepID=UPI00207764DC|nr:hypothetical protein [Azospirillum sp. A1-3]MCM8736588.1 hypothetical protein [Azospirillum sp. A1-3]